MTDPHGPTGDPGAAPRTGSLAAGGALPGVSYVMPVLNEVTHVEAAIASLLDQD
jgi:hypothetical protein